MWLPLQKTLNDLNPSLRSLFVDEPGKVPSLKIIPYRPEVYGTSVGLIALGKMIAGILGSAVFLIFGGWLLADGGRFTLLGGLGALGPQLQSGLLILLGLTALLLIWPFFQFLGSQHQIILAALASRKPQAQFGFFLFPDTLVYRPAYNILWVIPKIDVLRFEEGKRRERSGEETYGKIIYRPLNVDYALEFCKHPTVDNNAPREFTLPLGTVLMMLKNWKAAK